MNPLNVLDPSGIFDSSMTESLQREGESRVLMGEAYQRDAKAKQQNADAFEKNNQYMGKINILTAERETLNREIEKEFSAVSGEIADAVMKKDEVKARFAASNKEQERAFLLLRKWMESQVAFKKLFMKYGKVNGLEQKVLDMEIAQIRSVADDAAEKLARELEQRLQFVSETRFKKLLPSVSDETDGGDALKDAEWIKAKGLFNTAMEERESKLKMKRIFRQKKR